MFDKAGKVFIFNVRRFTARQLYWF